MPKCLICRKEFRHEVLRTENGRSANRIICWKCAGNACRPKPPAKAEHIPEKLESLAIVVMKGVVQGYMAEYETMAENFLKTSDFETYEFRKFLRIHRRFRNSYYDALTLGNIETVLSDARKRAFEETIFQLFGEANPRLIRKLWEIDFRQIENYIYQEELTWKKQKSVDDRREAKTSKSGSKETPQPIHTADTN